MQTRAGTVGQGSATEEERAFQWILKTHDRINDGVMVRSVERVTAGPRTVATEPGPPLSTLVIRMNPPAPWNHAFHTPFELAAASRYRVLSISGREDYTLTVTVEPLRRVCCSSRRSLRVPPFSVNGSLRGCPSITMPL